MWFYYYEIRYCEEINYTEEEENGIVCAESVKGAMERLEDYYGKGIYEIRIVCVSHDCEEILPGKDFADVVGAIKNHLG